MAAPALQGGPEADTSLQVLASLPSSKLPFRDFAPDADEDGTPDDPAPKRESLECRSKIDSGRLVPQ
jgi:hypothetical protein